MVYEDMADRAVEIVSMRKPQVTTYRELVKKVPDIRATDKLCEMFPGYQVCVWCLWYSSAIYAENIKNAVIVQHAPLECAATFRTFFWNYFHRYWGGGHKFIVSTNMRESDVILGAEEKLKRTLIEVDKLYKPELIIVFTGCAPSMIGEDIEGVIESVRGQLNAKVLYIPSPGLSTWHAGMHIEHSGQPRYVELMEDTGERDPNAVNILTNYKEVWGKRFGVEGRFPTVLDEMAYYIEQLGLKVNTILMGGVTLEDIRRAPRASFNALECPAWSRQLAKEMERRFGIPYGKHAIPIGFEATEKWIMEIAEFFGKRAQAERLIKEEEAKYADLWREAKKLCEGKVLLIDGAISMSSGCRSPAQARFGLEMGMEPIIFNLHPAELASGKENVEYWLSETVGGKPFDAKVIWWEHPYQERLRVTEVMSMLGLKPNEVVYFYNDAFCWARAPDFDACNIPVVQSGIHWRRVRWAPGREECFAGTAALCRDIIYAMRAAKRNSKYTLYSRILGSWVVK